MKKERRKRNEMSFKEEFKQNATLFLFILMCVVGMLSDDFRNLLKENTVVVLPFFLLIAIAEIKEHLDDTVERIITTDRY
jgi:hypothetical protein